MGSTSAGAAVEACAAVGRRSRADATALAATAWSAVRTRGGGGGANLSTGVTTARARTRSIRLAEHPTPRHSGRARCASTCRTSGPRGRGQASSSWPWPIRAPAGSRQHQVSAVAGFGSGTDGPGAKRRSAQWSFARAPSSARMLTRARVLWPAPARGDARLSSSTFDVAASARPRRPGLLRAAAPDPGASTPPKTTPFPKKPPPPPLWRARPSLVRAADKAERPHATTAQFRSRPEPPLHHAAARRGHARAPAELSEGPADVESFCPSNVAAARPRRRSWCRAS